MVKETSGIFESVSKKFTEFFLMVFQVIECYSKTGSRKFKWSLDGVFGVPMIFKNLSMVQNYFEGIWVICKVSNVVKATLKVFQRNSNNFLMVFQMIEWYFKTGSSRVKIALSRILSYLLHGHSRSYPNCKQREGLFRLDCTKLQSSEFFRKL